MTLYLDTSSLLKLYVQEAGSDDVRQLVDEASVVATSMVAYPESRAALALFRRSGEITAARIAKVKPVRDGLAGIPGPRRHRVTRARGWRVLPRFTGSGDLMQSILHPLPK